MNSENEKWAEVSRTASAKRQLWRAACHPALHPLLWTKHLQQGISALRHLCHAFWQSHTSTSGLTYLLTYWVRQFEHQHPLIPNLFFSISYHSPAALFSPLLSSCSGCCYLIQISTLTAFASTGNSLRLLLRRKIHFYMLKFKYQTAVGVYLLWTRQRSSSFTLFTQ